MPRLAVLAILAAVAAAGCGGGHDSRTPYAKSLDALCKTSGEQIASVPKSQTPAELVTERTKVNAIGSGFVRRLKALSPSAAERTQARRLVVFYDDYWSVQPVILHTLATQQYNVYGRLEDDALEYEKRAEAIAQQLGTTECAKHPVR